MAKKGKKGKGRTGRRRRRVSGVHPGLQQVGMMILGAGVGAIGGVFVNQAIKSSFTSMPSWIGGGACVAGGAALYLFGPETPLVQGIAVGLAGTGAVFATNETFLSLPGISGVPAGLPNARPNGGFLSRSVAGYRGVPQSFIGGNFSGNDSKVVAGMGNVYRN